MPMGYHYAHFGADSNRAVQEGNYAVNSAQQAGLPQGSYLAADWEQDAHNNTNGGREASANAITALWILFTMVAITQCFIQVNGY